LDVRSFPWGNQSYTSAKFYEFLFSALPEDPAFSAIWKSKCMPKLRFFGWLLLMDRLNTKDLMHRIGMSMEGYLVFCVLPILWKHGITYSLIVPLQLLAGT
jgi:hypothetical protein